MIAYRQKATPSDWVEREVVRVLAEGRTAFQAYEFFETESHGLVIALDGDVQSCESDEAVYHEALAHPALLLHPAPKRVLIMGGGEGATAREALRHPSVEHVVMVDIDEEFVALCRRHAPSWGAGAFEDPRLETRYTDIREYVAEDGLAPFDVVIGDLVDACAPESPGAELYGAELFARLKSAMAPEAILATQCGALAPSSIRGRNRVEAELRETFDATVTLGIAVPSFFAMWGFMLASSWGGFARTPETLAAALLANAQARGFDAPALGAAALAAGFSLPGHVRSLFA